MRAHRCGPSGDRPGWNGSNRIDAAPRRAADPIRQGAYPHVEAEQIRAAAPDLVLLPDEPYRFTPDDGPEEFPGHRVVLVSGRLLTWYGPTLATARADLLSLTR